MFPFLGFIIISFLLHLSCQLLIFLYISGVYNWIQGYRETLNFPRADDLNGAAQAIVRLQDTYKLNMESLSGGVLLLSDPLSNEINKGKINNRNLFIVTLILIIQKLTRISSHGILSLRLI